MARKLTRRKEGAVLGGVAAGFGAFLDVDPVLVRLAFILLALADGLGVFFYVVCWVAMPRDAGEAAEVVDTAAGPGTEGPQDMGLRREHPLASARAAAGMLLIVAGSALLLDELGWLHWPHWLRAELVGPGLLIALGAALVARSGRRAAA